ncbi:hypothetical protein [Halalkalirubrum salinum]|uniref:hypothetical protein n=1 Tax=Halalkalirubrum salinum TaxID=2563889 RepID=UPI0010FB9CEA|nr:hypothetical protein [Halalkalirubrum salinum]
MTEPIAELEEAFRNHGIDVVDVAAVPSADPDRIELTYMTAYPGFQINHPEMGRALNTVIDLCEDDRLEPCRLEATVVRSPDDPMGVWHAKPEWFRDLAEYKISEETFSTRVLSTITHTAEESNDAPEGQP